MQRLLDAIKKERRKAAAAELAKAGSVPAGAPGRAAEGLTSEDGGDLNVAPIVAVGGLNAASR